jgi:Family of unknown function (DUF5985)
MMVPGIVYGLCMLTALMCAWFLLQAYRKTHYRLLFWCSLFFSMSAMNNVFLVVDKVIYQDIDLTVYRYLVALAGLCVLLPGLILEPE